MKEEGREREGMREKGQDKGWREEGRDREKKPPPPPPLSGAMTQL